MSVIFIDTNCEINYKTAEELGLKNIIQMPYTICDKEYLYDLGKNYDAKEFFGLVRAGNMPITSGLNSETYRDYFEPYFKAAEDILYISFSSELSNTFTYLDIAIAELKEKYPEAKFTRFDTKGISLAAGIPVYVAAKMHNEGKTNQEIVTFLSDFIYRVNAVFSPNSLFYLKKGGRISTAKAALGTMLQLKPIIRLNNDGKLVNTQQVQGRNKSINFIINDVLNNVTDIDKYPIIILNADCAEDSDKIEKKLRESLPVADIWIYDVGPVRGTHCGPDTIACVYVGKNRLAE